MQSIDGTTGKYRARPWSAHAVLNFSVDNAMVCQRGGFIIQRHNERRDLEAEMLRMVCNDV